MFFFVVVVAARLSLFGIIVTPVQGDCVWQNEKHCNILLVFFIFFFSSEEEDHTLLCRISRTRQAINAAHHFAGGQHTHKKQSLPTFFRRAVVVFKSWTIFFINFFSLFWPVVRCFYIYFLRSLPLWSSSSLLITKHPRGVSLRKKVNESDSSHQPHCHTKPPPPVLQPLWNEL